MRWKRLGLALAMAAGLAACATTTSPTGRTQYMAYSDSELNQMGAQAFTEMKSKQKTQTGDAESEILRMPNPRVKPLGNHAALEEFRRIDLVGADKKKGNPHAEENRAEIGERGEDRIPGIADVRQKKRGQPRR